MRIRKNAKLSPLMFSQGSSEAQPLQTHVCQLNQSPWDVISFSQETYYPSSSLYQFEGEDSFNGNGSLGDSVGAVESVASMMMEDSEEKGMMKMKVDHMVIVDDNYENEGNKRSEMFGDYEEMKIDSEFKLKKCNKTDGKGWHCKNDTKNGHTVCDHHHHLTSHKSSYSNINNNINGSAATKKPDKVASIIGARRGRAKSAKKGSSSSSNPYEFYYYSGFGPLWGKRRGDKDTVNKNEAKDVDNSTVIGSMIPNTTPSSSYSPIENNQGFDYVDEDDDDEEEDSGKKRMRKPVKARSLKSLM